MNIEIRHARLEDKPRCLELLGSLMSFAEGSASPEAGDVFDQLLDRQRGEVIVAVEDEHILGMASVSYGIALRYGGEYCLLEELIVDPDGRGKNIGGQLLERTIETATSRGCADFGIYLVEATEHNLPFYERFGFKKVGSELRQPLRVD